MLDELKKALAQFGWFLVGLVGIAIGLGLIVGLIALVIDYPMQMIAGLLLLMILGS